MVAYFTNIGLRSHLIMFIYLLSYIFMNDLYKKRQVSRKYLEYCTVHTLATIFIYK